MLKDTVHYVRFFLFSINNIQIVDKPRIETT